MNGSAAMRAASASNARPRRRRLVCSLPYLRFLPTYSTAQTPLPRDLRSELLCLLPKFIQVAVVLYHHVGPPGLLLLRELSLLDRPQRRLVHSPLCGPRPPAPLGHDDGDGIVEGAAAPPLEQERYLGHEDVGTGGFYTPVGLAPHERVQDVLEVLQGLCVPKNLAAERPAVYAPPSKDVLTEALCDPYDGLLVLGEEAVDDLVGRGRLGP